jgi:hypothetical protein
MSRPALIVGGKRDHDTFDARLAQQRRAATTRSRWRPVAGAYCLGAFTAVRNRTVHRGPPPEQRPRRGALGSRPPNVTVRDCGDGGSGCAAGAGVAGVTT